MIELEASKVWRNTWFFVPPLRRTWKTNSLAASFSYVNWRRAVLLVSRIKPTRSGVLVSRSKWVIVCSTPSSNTWKSSLLRSMTGCPRLFKAVRGTLTSSTVVLMVELSLGARSPPDARCSPPRRARRAQPGGGLLRRSAKGACSYGHGGQCQDGRNCFPVSPCFLVRPSPDDAMRIRVFMPVFESPAILPVSGSSEFPILPQLPLLK